MMSNLKKLALLFFICFTVVSCGDEDGIEADACDPTSGFPYLVTGNQWVYTYSSFLGGENDFTVGVEEEVEPGTFKISSTDNLFPDEYYWHTCGVNLSGLESTTDDLNTNIFRKSNVPIGATWSGTNNGETGNYEVLNKNVSVTTLAGSFVCDVISINLTGAFNTDTIFESPTVGTVKYSGILFDYELKSKNF